MNITILTVGTRGDIQPYVALGAGLQAAGHQVTLGTSSEFASLAAAHGLNHAPLNFDAMAMMASQEGRDAVGGKGKLALLKRIRPIMRQLLDDCWQASQGADALIFNPKALGGYHCAEKLGIPALLAHPVPMFVPTAAFPVPAQPAANLGSWLNKQSYQLVLGAAQAPLSGIVNQWRSESLELPPAKSETMLHGEPVPVLYGFSRHVVPQPDDWPEHVHVTGYWFLDRPGDWQPPADLAAFLEAGPPPVYIGFGSMAGRDAAATTADVVAAVRSSGVRALLATGVGGLQAPPEDEAIFALREAPHDWLFPRVAAVVHHGGAGTTAAAFRAGRPQLICPFFGDQPFWGRRVAALGVGPAPISQRALNAERLHEALTSLVSNQGFQAHAAALGEQIRAENGIAEAVAQIEQQLAGALAR